MGVEEVKTKIGDEDFDGLQVPHLAYGSTLDQS